MVLEYVEIAARWLLGLQMIFWGLNGYFGWIQFQRQPPVIENFIKACFETRFIMPFVKIWEIGAGSLLIFNLAPKTALILLYPILAVVIPLHLLHNRTKWYEVVLPLGIPSAVLGYYYFLI